MNVRLRWRMASRALVGAAFAAPALLLGACSSESEPVAPSPEGDGSIATPGQEAGTNSQEAGTSDADAPETNDAGDDAATPRVCSSQNFCHTVLPENQLLRAVWGDGQGTVWSVSAGGSILRWDGTTWTVHATNPDDHYSSIWGSGPTDIWIGGNGKILHGTGASASALVFTPVTLPAGVTADITGFASDAADEIWAVGGTLITKAPASAKGCLLHYAQGEWSLDETVRTDVAYTRVWSTPSTGMWIGGNATSLSGATSVGVFRRAPGASSFAQVTLPSTLVGTATGNPFRFDSGDATTDTTMVILGAVRTAGFAARTVPVVWRGTTEDDGATFTWKFDPRGVPDLAPPPPDFALTAVWVEAPDDTWAAGASGRLRHWDGTAWSQAAFSLQKIPDLTQLSGIWGKDSTDFWVVGDNVALHKMP